MQSWKKLGALLLEGSVSWSFYLTFIGSESVPCVTSLNALIEFLCFPLMPPSGLPKSLNLEVSVSDSLY